MAPVVQLSPGAVEVDVLNALVDLLQYVDQHIARGAVRDGDADGGTGDRAERAGWVDGPAVLANAHYADSDAFEQLKRSVSILTGWTQERSAKLILEDRVADVSDKLTGLPIRINYNASPTLDVIESQLEAYQEVYGDYPDLVVIDNVTNVRFDRANGDDDPFSGLESLMDYLHSMARETEACVIGLHHVTGQFNDSAKPIPLSGVKGQITRVPELVLTLHKKPGNDYIPDTLCVSTVKNRGGKADPSGSTFVELDFDGETMTIRDRVFD